MKQTTDQADRIMVRFSSEAFRSIPLPPEVSFEQAFSRMDADSNSFYLLGHDDESYMQCGGSLSACTVELRRANAEGIFRSYVVGRDRSADLPVHITMSQGGVWVHGDEVLTVEDAVRLFECFFKGQALPSTYALRDRELDPLSPPQDEDKADALDPDGQNVQDSDDSPAVRWLAADHPENGFGIGGFDCTAYVRSRIAMTADPRVAPSFADARTSTGAEHTGHLPDGAVALACVLTYELATPVEAGSVYRAAAMEDKWDIFHQDNRLVFCRSWTGLLALVAEVRQDGSTLAVQRVWAALDLVHGDASLAVRQVDYLIRSHVLGHTAPHPLPGSLPTEPQGVGDYSFGIFGRNCCFGSFEDTSASPTLQD